MIEEKSQIVGNYQTIKITKSRIDKGLMAIPVTLLDRFPTEKTSITIFLDNETTPYIKSFVPYNSTSKECRIGGLSKWFAKNQFKDKDEIVIDFIDEKTGIYRLRKESIFLEEITQTEKDLIKENNILELDKKVKTLVNKTKISEQDFFIYQYHKIKDIPIKKRAYKNINISKKKENVPPIMRKILESIYGGHCQISDFLFYTKKW